MRTGVGIWPWIATLAAAVSAGCTSQHGEKPPGPSPVALQEQRSAALTGGRYAALFRDIEEGRLEEAKDDMDLWIDMSILQLQLLEERYPNGDWAAVQTNDSGVRMEAFYKRIAQYRRDHPRRRQSVPWDAESLKRIQTFVEKYQ